VSVGLVIQVIVAGLAAGAVYGLVAIGFTLVYRLTSVLQFAHGDIVGGSLFLALVVESGTGPITATSPTVLRYAVAVALTLAITAIASAAVYMFLLRPFTRRGSAVGWIGATVALAFVIQGALAAAFPREAYVVSDPFPFSRWRPISLPNGASLPPRTLFVLAIGLVLAAAVGVLLTRSRFGRAVSAIASEPLGAQIVGLPVDRLTASAFALAGALAAAAGLIGTPSAGAIGTQTGLLLGLKAIAAAWIGGLASPRRVFVAALAVGVFEAAVTTLHVPGFPHLMLGPAWRDIAPLLAALVVVVLRSRRDLTEIAE
jgi:branched-chain amino acid transport system permease protein